MNVPALLPRQSARAFFPPPKTGIASVRVFDYNEFNKLSVNR